LLEDLELKLAGYLPYILAHRSRNIAQLLVKKYFQFDFYARQTIFFTDLNESMTSKCFDGLIGSMPILNNLFDLYFTCKEVNLYAIITVSHIEK
jgi:hypothetical protein